MGHLLREAPAFWQARIFGFSGPWIFYELGARKGSSPWGEGTEEVGGRESSQDQERRIRV